MADVQLAVTLENSTASFPMEVYAPGVRLAKLKVTLSDSAASFTAGSYNAPSRFTTNSSCALFDEATRACGKVVTPSEPATALAITIHTSVEECLSLTSQWRVGYDEATGLPATVGVVVEEATNLNTDLRSVAQQGTPINIDWCVTYEQATSNIQSDINLPCESGTFIDQHYECPFEGLGAEQVAFYLHYYVDPPMSYTPVADFDLGISQAGVTTTSPVQAYFGGTGGIGDFEVNFTGEPVPYDYTVYADIDNDRNGTPDFDLTISQLLTDTLVPTPIYIAQESPFNANFIDDLYVPPAPVFDVNFINSDTDYTFAVYPDVANDRSASTIIDVGITQTPTTVEGVRTTYTPPVPPLQINFDEDTTDYDFTVYPDVTNDRSVSFDFALPYNDVIADVLAEHQHGILRADVNTDSTLATRRDEKWCIIQEEASYPDPGVSIWIDYPRPTPPPGGNPPPGGTTHTIPDKDVYRMENIITVTLDDDITVIQMDNLRLSDDAGRFAWSFSGDLLKHTDVALLRQAEDGTPKLLYVTINGYVWHIVVEKLITRRVFGEKTVSVAGRGLSSLLTRPYMQPATVNYGNVQTVQQLADLISPIGWVNVWSCVTWNVDAGAFSYTNKTPIEALKGIADDIGAIIIPSRDSQSLEFKPRYPVLPWNFDGTQVDVAIPEAAIIELTEEPVSSFQGNGVYVHGGDIGGELGFCKLTGTAGDRLLPTISNSLMTDVVGLRALGERLLSAQAPQPLVKSIKCAMDGVDIPLIEKGSFIGVTLGGTETKGIVNSVSISAQFGEVFQDLTIGESTPNAWVAFTEILPKSPTHVATLSSTDGVTSLMTMYTGGAVRVRGTGTVASKYYIQDGAIVGDAPNQPLSNILV